MKRCGIYVIRNIVSGDFYAGSSVDVDKRFSSHRSMLSRGVHVNVHLQRAWQLYGSKAFAFELVEAVARDLLTIREQDWVLRASYNVAKDTERPPGFGGRKHSAQTKVKMSLTHFGVKLSDAARAKVSAAQKLLKAGYIPTHLHTSEVRAKISAAKLGVKLSAWHRLRCSEASKARRGVKLSAEHRAKLSEAKKGKFTEAQREYSLRPRTQAQRTASASNIRRAHERRRSASNK